MKIINFRPIFYGFISFMLGLFFCRFVFSINISFIILSGILFISMFLLSIFTKNIKRLIVVICFFIVGCGCFYIQNTALENAEDFTNKVKVSAYVNDVANYENYQIATLNYCKINDKDNKYNISCFISGQDYLPLGANVSFNAHLTKQNFFSLGDFNSFCYTNNIMYIADIVYDSLEISSVNKNLVHNIQQGLHNFLSSSVGEQSVGLIESVLIGQKDNLNKDIKQVYIDGGIAHLLAISGLHISFLVAIFAFILNKFKINRKVIFVIMAIFLLFYCFLCGFSCSVVRASIMAIVLLLSELFGKKYDRLNALAIAGFCILIVSPFQVFSAGFLLSFGCVFSIFTLFNPIYSLLKRVKIPNWLCLSFSMVFAVQVGILPVSMLFFENFSLYSLLLNLLAIPLFEVAYILVVCFTLIGLIFPFLKFLVKLPEFLFGCITFMGVIVSGESYAIVNFTKISCCLVCCIMICYFIISGYFMSNKIMSSCICFLLIAVGFITSGIEFLPYKRNEEILGCVSNVYQSEFNYVITSNNKIFVIGEMGKNSNLTNYLNYLNISKIDYFICSSFSGFYSDINISNIITIDQDVYNYLQTEKCMLVEKNTKFQIDDLNIKIIVYASAVSLVNITTETKDYLFAINKLPLSGIDSFYNEFSERNLQLCGKQIITDSYSPYITNYNCFNLDLKSLTKSKNPFVNWTLSFNGDKIRARRLI